MPGMIKSEGNSRGGVDLRITTPEARVADLSLSPHEALNLASSILTVLGAASITNRPDGTWIAG